MGSFIAPSMINLMGDQIMQTIVDRRHTVIEFFRLIGQGRIKEGLGFFAPDCKQHNPYILGGIDALLESMTSAFKEGTAKYPEADFKVVNFLVDGDAVMVHTQLLNRKESPEQGGLRQAHLFRFKGDKIVEYWDITQQITPDMPNASGAF
jgi:predicted SnoaL-like aldol condensation-catalyzing enzyme